MRPAADAPGEIVPGDGGETCLTRRRFLGVALSGLAWASSPPWLRDPRGRIAPVRPNLIFILADDLGYGDLSSYGRPDYHTPQLDRLAREGVRLTNAYSAASVCTPTRAGLMTGRYPARLPSGLQEPMTWVNTVDGLPPEHPTIASLLKRAGYTTALVGKWHLGYRPEFGPLHHGFDEFFGILSGGVGYFTHRDAKGKPDLHEGLVPVERVGYLTDLLTEHAAAYIARKRSRPFYLSLHYTAPHWPWEGPADRHASATRKDFEGGGSLTVFAAMVQSLDAGIGRVLKAVSDAGLDRDTLVIFTSDNGGERFSYNWPHSEGKATLWEGGIRVPAIVRWIGSVPAGRATEQIAITMDWTATMLAAAGASADPGYPIDGVDLLPVCARQRGPIDRTLFWRQPFLRYNRHPPQQAVRDGRWKYLDIAGSESLFDLSADPGEKVDLKGERPEILARLRESFRRWDAELPPRPAPPEATR